MRKWGFKLLYIVVVLILVGCIGSVVYLVKARMQLVEFRFQIESLFVAASMASEEWEVPDEGNADKIDGKADPEGNANGINGSADLNGDMDGIDGSANAEDHSSFDTVLPDLSKAIVASYGGTRTLIAPGNYRALLYYLELDPAMRLISHPDRKKAVRIDICDLATIYAAPMDASGEKVLVELQTKDQTFLMQVHGFNHWEQLLACCTEGTYHDENIPLS